MTIHLDSSVALKQISKKMYHPERSWCGSKLRILTKVYNHASNNKQTFTAYKSRPKNVLKTSCVYLIFHQIQNVSETSFRDSHNVQKMFERRFKDVLCLYCFAFLCREVSETSFRDSHNVHKTFDRRIKRCFVFIVLRSYVERFLRRLLEIHTTYIRRSKGV